MTDRSSIENMSHMLTFSYLETFLFSPSQAAMASCFVAVCAANTPTMESWTWRREKKNETYSLVWASTLYSNTTCLVSWVSCLSKATLQLNQTSSVQVWLTLQLSPCVIYTWQLSPTTHVIQCRAAVQCMAGVCAVYFCTCMLQLCTL